MKVEYTASVLDPGHEAFINSIEVVQNNTARFIFGNYHRTASVTSTKKTLSLYSVADRRKIYHFLKKYILITTSCFIHSLTPSYSPSRHDPIATKVSIPFCRTNACFTTFLLKAPLEWNRLPPSIETNNNTLEFNCGFLPIFQSLISDVSHVGLIVLIVFVFF